MPNCARCGIELQEQGVEYFGDKPVCCSCFQFELIESRAKAELEAEQCSRCMKKMPLWGVKEFNGRKYCTSCYDAERQKYRDENSCIHCGRLLEKPIERMRGPHDELLCEKCLSEMHGKFGPGARTGASSRP